MWICQRCQAQNRDTLQSCPVCGTMRTGSRFGSAPPRVTAAAPQMQELVQSGSLQSGYEPPEEKVRTSRNSRKKGGRFVRFVGISLCVLLPLLTFLSSLVLLMPWWLSLIDLQQKIAANSETVSVFSTSYIPVWLGWVLYGMVTLTALLLSLLPGLWTLSLNNRR